MKKAVLILLILSIAAFLLILYNFKDYSIVRGCVIVGENLKKPTEIAKAISMLNEEEKKSCESLFVIEVLEIVGEGGHVQNVEKKHEGIKYFITGTTPLKKYDDDIDQEPADPADTIAESENVLLEETIQAGVDNDFSIFFINAHPKEGFSEEEVEETVVNIQSKIDSAGVIITTGFEIPEEKQIRNSLKLVNLKNSGNRSVITFSLTKYGLNEKTVNIKTVRVF